MKLGIAGAGLIGASIGLRARALGWNVTGFDSDWDAAAQARERGAIEQIAPSLEGALAGADVAVLAMPVDALLTILAGLRAHWPAELSRPGLLIDVGSVKVAVIEAARGLPGFVGTHPIAGSERSGPGAAAANLFAGRPWAFVPVGDPVLDGRAEQFIGLMGARPLATGAEQHDRVLALTSHLPQTISVVLATLLERAGDPEIVRALAGPGLESMTRLAQSPFAMWRGVYEKNGHNVTEGLQAMVRLMQALVDGSDVDRVALEQYFTEANSLARSLVEGQARQ